jgi:hypothetical protein
MLHVGIFHNMLYKSFVFSIRSSVCLTLQVIKIPINVLTDLTLQVKKIINGPDNVQGQIYRNYQVSYQTSRKEDLIAAENFPGF